MWGPRRAWEHVAVENTSDHLRDGVPFAGYRLRFREDTRSCLPRVYLAVSLVEVGFLDVLVAADERRQPPRDCIEHDD